MPEVVVAGVPGALTEELRERLSAAGGCRLVTPDAGELEALDGGETLVYAALAGVGLGGVPDPAAAERVFARAASAGVRHLILLSSAAVHEPSAHHPGHVAEARRLPRRRGNRIAAGWRVLEGAARRGLGGSATVLTVLRPPAVLRRGGGDYWSRLFAGGPAFVLPGFDPSLQLLDPADLARAVARVVAAGADAAGVFNLAPRAVVPLKKALRTAGCRRLPVPRIAQWPVRRLLAPGWAAPVDQLEYVRYPWTVSAEKLRRRLGFEARSTSAQAVARLSRPTGGDAQRGGARPAAPGRRGRRPYRGLPPAAEAAGQGLRSGAGEPDPFGMDPDYVARLGKTLFRFLHDVWWRVEWQGLDHVPRQGRAVLAGVHRGHQPWDGVMTFHLLVRELGRYPRYLIHPTLVKFPFLAPYMVKCGGIHACRENAAWVLERDGLLAIFPEGIRGAFTMYRDAYTLGKFGRDEYVKIALAHRAPIIPYVTVGSAEIFPILGRIDWAWWKRYSEWPFFPVTPTMGTVPLPSKWHTAFLEPVTVDDYPPEAASDRETVKAISARVRMRMEAAFADMLSRRKSIWWGSIFDREPGPALEKEAA